MSRARFAATSFSESASASCCKTCCFASNCSRNAATSASRVTRTAAAALAASATFFTSASRSAIALERRHRHRRRYGATRATPIAPARFETVRQAGRTRRRRRQRGWRHDRRPLDGGRPRTTQTVREKATPRLVAASRTTGAWKTAARRCGRFPPDAPTSRRRTAVLQFARPRMPCRMLGGEERASHISLNIID